MQNVIITGKDKIEQTEVQKLNTGGYKSSQIKCRPISPGKPDGEKDKDELQPVFIANMVHELRTPAAIVKSYAGLLQAPGLPEKDKDDYARVISRCSDHLLTLINDLLDFSKITSGQLSLSENLGNIKDLFDDLLAMFGTPGVIYEAEQVQLKSTVGLNPSQCNIYADFTRLKQVLVNLVSNALKFTSNGYVHFGCSLSNDKTLQFFVEDTGIGIEPAMHDVVFEPYKQVPGLHQEKGTGTGLGLAIVKSLVGLMNGKIWLESTPGKGSTFYFTLPFKKVAVEKYQPLHETEIFVNL
jgi:signal transduction histidine kinase